MWQMLPKTLSIKPNALLPARSFAPLVRGPAVTVLIQKRIARAAGTSSSRSGRSQPCPAERSEARDN